jgi:hypothetical protein
MRVKHFIYGSLLLTVTLCGDSNGGLARNDFFIGL